MSAGTTSRRIVSMDQFRGYTVAGMFLVNFLGEYAAIHPVLKHNNTYFSYADSIMPSFMFAVGFSFRLTYLRRRSQSSRWSTVWTYVRRSLALVVLSLVMYGFGGHFRSWAAFDRMPPEFEPFRPKAPPTQSFDLLLAQAKSDRPGGDPPEIIADAQQIGTMILRPEPARPEAKERFAVAQKAAQAALAEGRDFVPAAVEREKRWNSLDSTGRFLVHWRGFLGRLLKSDLWETLAIIGVTQLVVLPFIGCGFLTRFLVMIGLGVTHCLISYWFNWDFVYAINDTWLSKLWMTGDSQSWDGGFFGPLCWGVAMVAGTLAYDLVSLAASHKAACGRLIVWGVVFMAVGYAMSCLTRVYELSPQEIAARKDAHIRQDAEKAWLERVIQSEQMQRSRAGNAPSAAKVEGEISVLRDQQERFANLELAESPVLPPWERLKGRTLSQLVVEPPFVAPPKDGPPMGRPPQIERRPWNYWMMGKRMPSVSFITFATGFAFALYGLFIAACDVGGLRLGIFTTFGTNALAAYFLHHVVEEAVHPLVPSDSPLWYCLAGLAFFFVLTYALVRFLEKRKIYLRL